MNNAAVGAIAGVFIGAAIGFVFGALLTIGRQERTARRDMPGRVVPASELPPRRRVVHDPPLGQVIELDRHRLK